MKFRKEENKTRT
uniref:Uncharacterized protein n=1 Tax=Arundo donax TaxID=35708 RepID=A0A0A9C066_ARUDO